MPILDLQQRAREIGRIRIGRKVSGTTRQGKAYTRPDKLDRFRFTCSSEEVLKSVAALYGGEVQPWESGNGFEQYELVSTSKRIPIMMPPEPVSQWYEKWSAAGCIHRCDGVTNVLTDEPCDRDGPDHAGAKATTRLKVVLRDVVGVGVWRLETHGINAAMELPAAADFLAAAGGYVNGWLSLEERQSKGTDKDGKPETYNFVVPIIELDVTPAELMAGKGRVQPPALEGPNRSTLPDEMAVVPAIASSTRVTVDPGNTHTAPDQAPAEHPMPHEDSFDSFSFYLTRASKQTNPEDVRGIWREANNAGSMTDELSKALQGIVVEMESRTAGLAQHTPAPEPVPDAEGVYEATVVEDPPETAAGDDTKAVQQDEDADRVWAEIVQWAGLAPREWTTTQLTDDFFNYMGMPAGEASGHELRAYLNNKKKEGQA